MKKEKKLFIQSNEPKSSKGICFMCAVWFYCRLAFNTLKHATHTSGCANQANAKRENLMVIQCKFITLAICGTDSDNSKNKKYLNEIHIDIDPYIVGERIENPQTKNR